MFDLHQQKIVVTSRQSCFYEHACETANIKRKLLARMRSFSSVEKHTKHVVEYSDKHNSM